MQELRYIVGKSFEHLSNMAFAALLIRSTHLSPRFL